MQPTFPNGKADLLVAFVLDESGSMASIKKAAMDGFNAFLRDQREAEGKVLFALTRFESEVKLGPIVPIAEAEELGHHNYKPGTSTALFDAIVRTMQRAQDADRAERVLLVVLTDGHENASTTYRSVEQVKAKIEEARKGERFDVAFVGPEDNPLSAEKLGIRPGYYTTIDFAQPAQVRGLFGNLSVGTAQYAAASSIGLGNAQFANATRSFFPPESVEPGLIVAPDANGNLLAVEPDLSLATALTPAQERKRRAQAKARPAVQE